MGAEGSCPPAQKTVVDPRGPDFSGFGHVAVTGWSPPSPRLGQSAGPGVPGEEAARGQTLAGSLPRHLRTLTDPLLL